MRNFLFFFIVLTLALGRCFSVWAAERERRAESEPITFTYRNVTTKQGLTFRVPEDMPIEYRDGMVAPIPFDEYMYGKFKQMDFRMQRIESKLERVIRKLSALDKRRKQD